MKTICRLFFFLLLPLTVNSAEIGFGTYGNWCGLNHPVAPKTAAPPIDQLDASCERHDRCYVEKGQYSCDCDATIQKEISGALKANQFKGETKHFARTAHHYFKGSPCNGTPKSKTGPTKAIQNLLNKGKNVGGKLIPSDDHNKASMATENSAPSSSVAPITSASEPSSATENPAPTQDDSSAK